jgi:Lipase (class 3)
MQRSMCARSRFLLLHVACPSMRHRADGHRCRRYEAPQQQQACTRRAAAYRVSVMNFACPRVGNARFAAAFKRVFPNTLRVYNADDLVPMVPFTFGVFNYRHFPSGVVITEQGKLGFADAGGAPASRLLDLSGLRIPESKLGTVCSPLADAA